MKRSVFLMLACILLAGFTLNAQVNATGTLLGTITDKSGASVPSASVKATNTDTGLSRQTTTNESGEYRFNLLPAGTYKVQVTMSGFAQAVFANVGLAVSQTTTLDATLSPSTQAETITVEATGAALVDTTRPTSACRLRRRRLRTCRSTGATSSTWRFWRRARGR